MKSLLMGELKHNLCSKLFRRSLLQDYEYKTFEHFTNGEDGCLFYQLLKNTNKIVQIDASVYNYFQNVASSSQVRYKNDAIKCICILNKIRHDVTATYSDLDILRHRCITHIFYDLYSQGYSCSTSFNEFITELGLQDYKLLSLDYFSVLEIIKLWIKRYVIGFVFWLKSVI